MECQPDFVVQRQILDVEAGTEPLVAVWDATSTAPPHVLCGVSTDLDNCALKCSTTLSIASTEALRVYVLPSPFNCVRVPSLCRGCRVRLHCRQCKVATVAVNGVNAVFTYSADTLACVVQDVDASNGAGAGAGEPVAARQRYRDLELYALNHR